MPSDITYPEQVATFAYRESADSFELCLIRRIKSGKWGIPKGLVDPGETHEEAALKEAFEEAGIEGTLVGAPIGTYQYEKWQVELTVQVYVMRVTNELEEWDEMTIRERHWLKSRKASNLLDQHPALPLLPSALDLILQETGLS